MTQQAPISPSPKAIECSQWLSCVLRGTNALDNEIQWHPSVPDEEAKQHIEAAAKYNDTTKVNIQCLWDQQRVAVSSAQSVVSCDAGSLHRDPLS